MGFWKFLWFFLILKTHWSFKKWLGFRKILRGIDLGFQKPHGFLLLTTRKISRDFPGFQVFRLIHHVSCAFPCIPRIFHAMDIPMTTMPFFFTIITFDSWTLPQWYVLCDYFCSQRKIWWQALCCLHYSNGSSIMNAFKFSRKVSFQSFKRLSKRQSSTQIWP